MRGRWLIRQEMYKNHIQLQGKFVGLGLNSDESPILWPKASSKCIWILDRSCLEILRCTQNKHNSPKTTLKQGNVMLDIHGTPTTKDNI